MTNLVTPDNLGPEFEASLIALDKISLKIGTGLARQVDGTIVAVMPTVATATMYSEEYFGQSTNGTTSPAGNNRNITMTRTAGGRWTVAFATAHPDGVNYHVSLTAEEQSNLRDTPDMTIVQGSKTANGFSIQITTGDNGGTADSYIDTPFTVSIAAPVTVVTGVS